uniref:Small integral membrane protein 15 n=1 Tax=Takifugu rubripes TaxID=31033 RepID=A0A674MBW0_TAKRU
MRSIQEWAEVLAEWAKKDPCGFHIALILAVTPFFIAIALISRKLARMVEAYERKSRISRKIYPSSKKA